MKMSVKQKRRFYCQTRAKNYNLPITILNNTPETNSNELLLVIARFNLNTTHIYSIALPVLQLSVTHITETTGKVVIFH